MRTYSPNDRHEFDPGPCPRCGGAEHRVNWVEVHTSDETPGSVLIPGTVQCLNPACEWGPAGTTPSGQAGEVWESKLPAR